MHSDEVAQLTRADLLGADQIIGLEFGLAPRAGYPRWP